MNTIKIETPTPVALDTLAAQANAAYRRSKEKGGKCWPPPLNVETDSVP